MLFDHQNLAEWFKEEKRDLPWRRNPTPYQVWISEIMLQQTQIATVLPYYERWMTTFPTLKDLAMASIDEVIKIWEGLGYYSRARNLHSAANYILENYKGTIPSDPVLLSQIKGIGPYTLGAILSFAFHQRYPAVDGNVIRVLSRYFMIEDDVTKPKTQRLIREVAEKILPETESWIMVEALIELGATICRPTPKCSICPLKENCKAYLHGTAHLLPNKSKKNSITSLVRAVAIIQSDDKLLVHQVKEGLIMSGLHEFPYMEVKGDSFEISEFEDWIKSQMKIKTLLVKSLPETFHSFTRYQVKLLPFQFECKKAIPIPEYKWLTRAELQKVAFSSGHRRILELMIIR